MLDVLAMPIRLIELRPGDTIYGPVAVRIKKTWNALGWVTTDVLDEAGNPLFTAAIPPLTLQSWLDEGAKVTPGEDVKVGA